MRNPEGRRCWLVGKRRGLKSSGGILTNREVYNYFKDRSLVKSHKSGGVIEKHCIPLEFMGDLEETDSEVFQEKSPQISKEGIRKIQFGTIGKQFGQADVYDSTAEILNRNRAPCSRGRCKDNSRAGKGTRWKSQREVNRDEGIDNHGEVIIDMPERSLEMRGGEMIIKTTGGSG